MKDPITEQQDHVLRTKAFASVSQLGREHGLFAEREFKIGFSHDGHRMRLCHTQMGIYKPPLMRYLLSIRSVIPKSNDRLYSDQKTIQYQIYESHQAVDYDFMGTDPSANANQLLWEAYKYETPIIYFFGVARTLYQALYPAYIIDWDAKKLRCRVAFGFPGLDKPKKPIDASQRRYTMHMVQKQLHKTKFRLEVLKAYRNRCAMTGLQINRLLSAAKIVHRDDEKLGTTCIPNGLPLSSLHLSAFDANIIGVDPDYLIHVSKRKLEELKMKGFDGEKQVIDSLKALGKQKIQLPKNEAHKPSRDLLAMRFEQYKNVV